MKRICLSITLAFVLLASLALPVLASIDIQGIDYNFDAAETEWALRVRWTGRAPFEVKANEFYLQGPPLKETTVAEVEARIQEKFLDLLVEDTKLSTIDPEDGARQDPPVLSVGEEIVVVRNSDYLRTWKCYFKIHIYSLDDLETPESELRFVTRFQNVAAGQIPDNWWPEG